MSLKFYFGRSINDQNHVLYNQINNGDYLYRNNVLLEIN